MELHVACFMGLVSFVASRSEVLRISTKNKKRLLNAAARAIIQTATTSDTPLTDAGLDGTGEVIQVRLMAISSISRRYVFQGAVGKGSRCLLNAVTLVVKSVKVAAPVELGTKKCFGRRHGGVHRADTFRMQHFGVSLTYC